MFHGSREQQPSWESRRALRGPEGLELTPPSLEQGPWAKPTRRDLCLMQSGQFVGSRPFREERKSDEQGP